MIFNNIVVELNGDYWHVRELTKEHRLLAEYGTNEIIRGFCDLRNKVIYVDIEQDARSIRKTLIHELTHAVVESYALSYPLVEEQLENFVSAYLDTIRNYADELLKRSV